MNDVHPKSKIISYTQAAAIAQKLHKEGKKIVLKTGCFDIFHIGHARVLEFAKRQGDVLFVGVGSDATLRVLKGEGKPVFSVQHRAELLAALSAVDHVVILNEPLCGRIDHEKLISLIRPNYYILPPDDRALSEKRLTAKRYEVTILLKKQMRNPKTKKEIGSNDLWQHITREL